MDESIDLQVNGYAGVDFNADDVTPEQFAAACRQLKADGVDQILATVITASIDRLEHRLMNIVSAREADELVAATIRGIHIEGPFLNPEPGYIGAHPTEHARVADLDVAKKLIDAAGGLASILTLAPERDAGLKVTRWLSDHAVTVAAGHCNPTLDELKAAMDAGLSMFTHLGNGCPLMLHRHDNIVQRVLSLSDDLAIGFIADGIHVPFVALGNYFKITGLARAFIVTDAISAAGMGPGEYTLVGQRVIVDEDLATWSSDRSHLVGSAMTMPRVRTNLRDRLGFDDAAITLLTRTNPARAIAADSSTIELPI